MAAWFAVSPFYHSFALLHTEYARVSFLTVEADDTCIL